MSNKVERCINCNQTEAEVPLVAIRYTGKNGWVCSQCMPIFIHKPEQFASKLSGLDDSIPVKSV